MSNDEISKENLVLYNRIDPTWNDGRMHNPNLQMLAEVKYRREEAIESGNVEVQNAAVRFFENQVNELRKIGAIDEIVNLIDNEVEERELQAVIRGHRATIFGEYHEEEGLLEYYKKIFSAASKENIRDVMLEFPPHTQDWFDQTTQLYKGLLEEKDEITPESLIEKAEEVAESKYEATVMLAVAYDMKIHATDMRYRADIDIFNETQTLFNAYLKENPQGGFGDFINALPQDALDHFSHMAQQQIMPRDVYDIALRFAETGALNILLQRVITGDPKTAKFMIEKAEGRPFIALVGKAHMNLVDEDQNNYEQMDLEGALRQYLGEENVAAVEIAEEMDDEQLYHDQPDYTLDLDGNTGVISLNPARAR